MNPETYRVVRHRASREIWVLRAVGDTLTGAYGPVMDGKLPRDLTELMFEEHPDDLEWIIRAWDHLEEIKVG